MCATSAVGVAEPAIAAILRAAASLMFRSADSAMAHTVANASGMAFTVAMALSVVAAWSRTSLRNPRNGKGATRERAGGSRLSVSLVPALAVLT